MPPPLETGVSRVDADGEQGAVEGADAKLPAQTATTLTEDNAHDPWMIHATHPGCSDDPSTSSSRWWYRDSRHQRVDVG
eukprot:5640579-Pyramimonas_sp.AAC.1